MYQERLSEPWLGMGARFRLGDELSAFADDVVATLAEVMAQSLVLVCGCSTPFGYAKTLVVNHGSQSDFTLKRRPAWGRSLRGRFGGYFRSGSSGQVLGHYCREVHSQVRSVVL